jgi:hypothetical protein
MELALRAQRLSPWLGSVYLALGNLFAAFLAYGGNYRALAGGATIREIGQLG